MVSHEEVASMVNPGFLAEMPLFWKRVVFGTSADARGRWNSSQIWAFILIDEDVRKGGEMHDFFSLALL